MLEWVRARQSAVRWIVAVMLQGGCYIYIYIYIYVYVCIQMIGSLAAMLLLLPFVSNSAWLPMRKC